MDDSIYEVLTGLDEQQRTKILEWYRGKHQKEISKRTENVAYCFFFGLIPVVVLITMTVTVGEPWLSALITLAEICVLVLTLVAFTFGIADHFEVFSSKIKAIVCIILAFAASFVAFYTFLN